jgi:hypothetical protein
MDTETTVSHLSQSLSQAAESQRALLSDLTLYAKDESVRFTNLRMDRNSQALDKLSTCVGLPGLIGLQQEWLRDLMQDYAGQNMRLVGAWRGVAHTVVSEAKDAAGETVDRMHAHADDTAQQTEETLDHAQDLGHQAVHETSEQVNNIGQDLNNNYIQH